MSNPFDIRSSPTAPAWRLINSAVVMTRIAARYGIGAEALLAGSGVCAADLNDHQKRITTLQEAAVARSLMRLVPVPWIGLEVGQEYHFSANGKLGMAMMCCETLWDALQLALEYIHLTASYHQYFIRIDGEVGRARMRELIDLGEIRRFVCESELASVHNMACIGSGETKVFRELRFSYPRPGYASRYDDLFRCPVRFGAPESMIVFEARHLARPMKLANPLVRLALEKDCRELAARLKAPPSVTALVHQELAGHRGEFPTLDQLARRLHLSPRTIRRRLSEEQTSYKAILAEVRREKALELIRTTRLSMEEVALSLGFRETSSFYRAFKGWTGRTPGSFREKAL